MSFGTALRTEPLARPRQEDRPGFIQRRASCVRRAFCRHWFLDRGCEWCATPARLRPLIIELRVADHDAGARPSA